MAPFVSGLSLKLLTKSKRPIHLSSSRRSLTSAMNRRKKTCILLPAMGVEYPGMCRDAVRDFPYIKTLMKDCDDYLNTPLSEMMLGGDPHELAEPEYAGNATFVGTMCFWRILQNEYDLDHALSDHDVTVIGHSFGEYTALELTKACKTFEDALYISNLISVSCKKYGGEHQGMYSIKCKAQYKLDLEWLSSIIQKHNLYFANLNAPNQVIVSGLKQDINRMIEETGMDSYRESDGLRGVYISPKGAFHSPLVVPSAGVAEFHDQWNSIQFNERLKYDLYFNITGDIYDIEKGHNITKIMQTQVYSQVKFYECVRNYMKRNGGENDDNTENDDTQWNFVEVGPRNVMQKMMKDIAKYHGYDKEKKLYITSINSSKSIREFASILSKPL